MNVALLGSVLCLGSARWLEKMFFAKTELVADVFGKRILAASDCS